ncbi:MAG: DUF1631 family protein [Curvibacter sp.]
MSSRPASVRRTPQIDGLIREAARHGLDIMDNLLRQTREALQRQIDQTRDAAVRDDRARAVSALVQAAPELRAGFPAALTQAFERELDDSPATTGLEAGPSSIKFEQLELMDEREVQQRISAVRGLQQALLETEHELTELNTLVSAILGFDQVRPERNPFRPEVFMDALQGLLGLVQGPASAQAQCRQIMVPLLGKCLRPVYLGLLAHLRKQQVQPVRYVIQRHPAGSGMAPPTGPVPGVARAGAGPAAAPVAARNAVAAPGHGGGLAQQVHAGQLTVQQLHGLMSGAQQDGSQLVQEVVGLFMRNITENPHLLPPVRRLLAGMEPALLQLARTDLHFFSDKKHPARVLLEEIAQHSFAYESVHAEGFPQLMDRLELCLHVITPATATSDIFALALAQLREEWDAAERSRTAQQQAAVQALQQAERRNELADQIAEHIRKQPGTVLVPDVVVEFACGPWAQVMAQAQMEGKVDQPGEPDHVALLEDLFWSVRPDQTRQQPGQLLKLIPQLVQGLRRGLARIHYPQEQADQFFGQLFALHQGGMEGMSAARSLRAAPRPAAWLAPEEARDSGFMDDLGGPAGGARDAAATVPGDFATEFPATVPMGLVDRDSDTHQAALEMTAPDELVLEQLQPGSWVELQVSGQWVRLQLAWLSDNASLCLFSSSNGANHSMTRRMFERLVGQGQLRLVSQGPVVERAFNAVAALALRNSVYMASRDEPPN